MSKDEKDGGLIQATQSIARKGGIHPKGEPRAVKSGASKKTKASANEQEGGANNRSKSPLRKGKRKHVGKGKKWERLRNGERETSVDLAKGRKRRPRQIPGNRMHVVQTANKHKKGRHRRGTTIELEKEKLLKRCAQSATDLEDTP